MKSFAKRINSLDFIRGICILFMIVDHILFITLKYGENIFFNTNIFTNSLIWYANIFYDGIMSTARWLTRQIILVVLFLISGMSSSLSGNNKIRGLKLFTVALFISFVTQLISNVTNINISIIWGVLHCYATCILLSIPLKKIRNKYILATIFICTSVILFHFQPRLSENNNILLILGIPSKNFTYPIEYFPVLLWFGIFYFGLILGETSFDARPKMYFFKEQIGCINKLGKYSIYIYIAHVPIILLILYLIGQIP